MYIVTLAWLYVTLMMAVAEANASNGTILGAVITFVLYGLLPMGIVLYIMGTPGRRRAIKARELTELATGQTAPAGSTDTSTGTPDTDSKSSADAVAPMRKET